MTLVDTSVWVEHLRDGSPELARLLRDGNVLCHPFILGELACGNLRNRIEVLNLLETLPQALPAEHQETLRLIGSSRLYGRGLGWIDAHLLASALLTGCPLWTRDRRLQHAAMFLKIAV